MLVEPVFSLNKLPPRLLFSVMGRVSPPKKLPKPPPPELLPPRLFKADPINLPTSPERTLDKPEKNPSNEEDPLDDDGRLVVGRVNDDPPKVVSPSPKRLP